MSRATFVGGFGNGRSSVEKVGNALGGHFETVEAFTFSDLINNPELLRRASARSNLITHSAGALALLDVEIIPSDTYLISPPLPTSIPGLIARSFVKTARMYTPGASVHSLSDFKAAQAFSRSSAAELARHPLANLGQLGRISRFNATTAAVNAKSAGIGVSLVWTNNDTYFQPTQSDLDTISEHRIPVAMLSGEHDEVILRPEAFLHQVLSSVH